MHFISRALFEVPQNTSQSRLKHITVQFAGMSKKLLKNVKEEQINQMQMKVK